MIKSSIDIAEYKKSIENQGSYKNNHLTLIDVMDEWCKYMTTQFDDWGLLFKLYPKNDKVVTLFIKSKLYGQRTLANLFAVSTVDDDGFRVNSYTNFACTDEEMVFLLDKILKSPNGIAIISQLQCKGIQ